jgi:hypothetical protein
MSAPNAIETETLNRCGSLLRFAAENKSGLPVQVVADIENAWEAQSQSNWNPQVATKFWAAYDALCSHMRPVTLDTLSTSDSAVRPKDSWLYRLGFKTKLSVSRKWARGFLFLLIFFLIVSMRLAYIATTSDIMLADIQKLMLDGNKTVSDIRKLIADRPNGLEDDTDWNSDSLSSEARTWVAQLREELIDLWTTADNLYDKTNSVAALLWLGEYPLCKSGETPAYNHCYEKGRLRDPSSLKEVLEQIGTFYNFFATQSEVSTRTNQAQGRIAGLKSYLLPVFLGMLGACTYVVRTISDQIKDFTFSRTSPLRHILRVVLGSIVGLVVVTFIDAPTAVKLSASAWAFVAGYAIEPVFATFDAIADKLK